MIKVYLDNNVLIDIESGKYYLSDFLLSDKIEYYFSPSHIEELIEGEHLIPLSKDNRLKLIGSLAHTNSIQPTFTLPTICEKNPYEVYEEEKMPITRFFRARANNFASTFIVDRNRFMEILRKRKIDMNNISPKDILNELDDALVANTGISIAFYLKETDAIGRAVFCTLFNLLDFACYYKDKQTKHSDIARMHDASHAYYAQLCDYFVSQDKRMRYKTEAVYSYLGIETKVISTIDYVNIFLSDKAEKTSQYL